MAAMNCPDCGGVVSTHARACPTCGCPGREIRRVVGDSVLQGWWAWAVAVGYTLLLLALMVTFPGFGLVLTIVLAFLAGAALAGRWVGREPVAAFYAVAAVPLLAIGGAGLRTGGGELGVAIGVALLVGGTLLFWHSPTAQGTT